jgi:UDP-N-acetylglucosamine---dolichyl-phosphate N-acetylglucosaminyltransferase
MVTICALIAAFNEERSVGQVVRATAAHVSNVVVVDDGSTDATALRAREAGAIVLAHGRNLGKGSAVRTGLTYVLAQPYTHVLFLDADLQHDPGEIPKLLDRAERGVGEFVLGEREFDRDAMPAARFHSNVIGSRILSAFIGAEVADSQSGFRLVRSEWLRRVPLTGRGYEIETEMLIKLVRAGATLERVTVQRLQYEGARSKIRPFRDTFRTCMLALAYRYFPGEP